MESPSPAPGFSDAISTAVPTVGWPAKGSSRIGVKIRMEAEWTGFEAGETKTVKFVAKKPGVYPFYCTNFCSALHQEMQGYLAVKP